MPDVDRHARRDHGAHAEVAQELVELRAVERREAVKAGHHPLALGGRERRHGRLLRRAREQRAARTCASPPAAGSWPPRRRRRAGAPSGSGTPARLRARAAPSTRAICAHRAVAAHGVGERGERAALADDTLLALHHEQRGRGWLEECSKIKALAKHQHRGAGAVVRDLCASAAPRPGASSGTTVGASCWRAVM